MKHHRQRWLWLTAILVLTMGLTLGASGKVSSASSKATPMPMGHHMGPVTFKNDKQVAPAVTAMLMPAAAKACGRRITGSGSVKMIPVHVGRMSGPHVDLVVQLHNAGMMRKYGISGMFTGKPPVKWSGMAGSADTGMHGGLYVKMRLMPMMRAGHYTARIMLHDMSCGMMKGMMDHSLAYQTGPTKITLR